MVELTTDLVQLLIAVGTVTAILTAFFTKLKIDISQSKKFRQQEADWTFTELRSRIRWIDETTRDIRRRITPDASPEVRGAYQDLIDNLEDHRHKLQLVVDSVAEQQLQR